MIEFLYGLFYLGVLGLVVGCFAYLFVKRDRDCADRASDGRLAPPSRAAAKKAEELSGSYRLSNLESIFGQLEAIEAWGMVLELRFSTVQEQEFVQMIVLRNEVELCTPYLEPDYTDRFRQAATAVGLQARVGYTKGQYCVDVKGTWTKIASTISGIVTSIYGVSEGEEIEVRVFN